MTTRVAASGGRSFHPIGRPGDDKRPRAFAISGAGRASLSRCPPTQPARYGARARGCPADHDKVRGLFVEEEEELFPKLRETFGGERLGRMGTELAAAKRRHQGGTASAGDAGNKTREELYEQARAQDAPGRSTMTKDELAEAVGEDD